MTEHPTLSNTDGRPLLETVDGLLVDLDGVVLLGAHLVDGAAAALAEVRQVGIPIAFVTNNAARLPADLVSRLTDASVTADVAEVVTAAQAAADRLAADLSAGASVLVVGGPALHAAVAEAGLEVTATADADPAAVVQGWGPDVGWRELAEATVAVRAGARWVVTNRDPTLPTDRGALPGSGALVAAVALALDREPDLVVGKPERALFDLAVRRLGGAEHPLMVGDRLDTDIGGAARAGVPALLVLSGVTTPADVLAAPPADRPTFLGRDLRALLACHPEVRVEGSVATCGGIRVQAGPGGVEVSGSPDPSSDGLDGLRAAAALAWSGQLAESLYPDLLNSLDVD